MNHLIVQIVEVILFRTGSQIAFLIPVCFNRAIDTGEEHVVPYIKLPAVVQEWFVDVGLDNVCFNLPIVVLFSFLDQIDHTGGRWKFDAVASIWILSWFYDPDFVGLWLVLSGEFFELWVFWTFYVVGFGDVVEGVSFEVIPVIVRERFEEILFRTDTSVSWNVISDECWTVIIIERNAKAILCDKFLHPVAILIC